MSVSVAQGVAPLQDFFAVSSLQNFFAILFRSCSVLAGRPKSRGVQDVQEYRMLLVLSFGLQEYRMLSQPTKAR